MSMIEGGAVNARDKATAKMERIERLAGFEVWMVGKSSRNKSLTDKICRLIVNRMATPKPENDFLRDPLIDNDRGFDPDELDRFQRGE